MPGPYPPPSPTVAGTNITVSAFLNNPTRVSRTVDDLTTQRFVADVIFAEGPAVVGGAVLYDQVTSDDLYLTGGDVQTIAPGAEFPLLSSADKAPLVAAAAKYGAEVFLTVEEIRRDRRDVLRRELAKLRNNIIRKVDAVAIAALNAAPTLTGTASGAWGTAATDRIGDIAVGLNAINDTDLGYVADTILVNPAQELALLKDKNIRDALPRERDDTLIRTGNVGRLMGADVITTNRVPTGTVYFMQRKVAGSISDEVPLYAKPIEDERRERTYIHGGRVAVPFVTDPKAVYRMTGA
jgi:hypothetical protein